MLEIGKTFYFEEEHKPMAFKGRPIRVSFGHLKPMKMSLVNMSTAINVKIQALLADAMFCFSLVILL